MGIIKDFETEKKKQLDRISASSKALAKLPWPLGLSADMVMRPHDLLVQSADVFDLDTLFVVFCAVVSAEPQYDDDNPNQQGGGEIKNRGCMDLAVSADIC